MQTSPQAGSVTPLPPYTDILTAHRYNVLRHYTDKQTSAALKLYRLVKSCRDTGGGIRATRFLLSLYNGRRFQFDLTDFRCFDEGVLDAAFTVLQMDARHTHCEIHVLLDACLGGDSNVGAEFEHWAYDLRLKGACKKSQLPMVRKPAPSSMVFADTGKTLFCVNCLHYRISKNTSGVCEHPEAGLESVTGLPVATCTSIRSDHDSFCGPSGKAFGQSAHVGQAGVNGVGNAVQGV